MAIFVISDLHLDVKSNEKSMEVFGSRWKNYTERISNNWNKLIEPTDTVIVPGDISWALTTNDALYDLLWIEKLPGKKIIMKGNHDFWWSTVSKMKKFFSDNDITTIDILNNNALEIENYIIAGSRGWFVDKSVQNTELNVDYEKIINREVIRLKMSLDNAKKLKEETKKEILAFFHFPPVWADYCCEPIVQLLKEYDINRCYFGHIHGSYNVSGRFDYQGIEFNMISADFLDFIPLFIG